MSVAEEWRALFQQSWKNSLERVERKQAFEPGMRLLPSPVRCIIAKRPS
jgi:hypothetical protein